MNKIKMAMVGLLTLSGCDFKEPPPVEKKSGEKSVDKTEERREKAERETSGLTEPARVLLQNGFLDGYPVTGDIFVSNVEVGDRIFIKIRGTTVKPLFSPVYEEEKTSSWIDSHKYGRLLEYKRYDVGSSEYKRSYGKCKGSYRKEAGEKETPIFFGDDPDEYSLKYRIGNVRYSLGNVINTGESAHLVFQVREDMLFDSDELYLTVVRNPPESVRVGFLDTLGYCRGINEGDFRSGHDPHFRHIPGESLGPLHRLRDEGGKGK